MQLLTPREVSRLERKICAGTVGYGPIKGNIRYQSAEKYEIVALTNTKLAAFYKARHRRRWVGATVIQTVFMVIEVAICAGCQREVVDTPSQPYRARQGAKIPDPFLIVINDISIYFCGAGRGLKPPNF